MIKIEKPNSDAIVHLCSQAQLRRFLHQNGNPDTEVGASGVIHVPAFAEGRKAFMASKVRDCARWGCE